jgi:hypothetical protein
MADTIILVKLTPAQIERAKEINGNRKQITHAVLCGNYGQLFGTEKFCHKYFDVWKNDMKKLFPKSQVTDNCEIKDFNSTFNLVLILLKATNPQLKI